MTLEEKIEILIKETVKQTVLLEKIVHLLEAKKACKIEYSTREKQPHIIEESVPGQQHVEFTPETVDTVVKGLLHQNDRQTIEFRYGVPGERGYSVSELNNIHKVSKRWIRHIEAGALKELSRITNLTVEQVVAVLNVYAQTNHDAWLKREAQNIPNMPVENLGVSNRVKKSMKALGIKTVGELVQKTSEELRSTKNLGMASLKEVRDILTRLGLKLRDD